ncbi:fimbrial protein [Citrobacter amalonaticus]|uniref:fimbrial protein n=1 Tax=Citrobacter amalonaticus TaxID=35703 RepID=UPI001A2418DD|nr:type 1 fimbrial protein [Citrobacter amalonaticus]HDQ2812868.1 type 1 fimbrial protein [Citrobacter amalonaticus]
MSNIKKLSLIPLVILVSYVNITNAATGDDQGTVHFKGTVINPPCEVDTNSKDVTVTFTPVGTNGFSANGEEDAQTQDLAIKLGTCPADMTINLTFSGVTATTSEQLKAMTGTDPTGLGVVLYGTGTASNTKVTFDNMPNVAFAQTTPTGAASDLTFNYTAKLVATVEPETMKGGAFTADATYTIYYP